MKTRSSLRRPITHLSLIHIFALMLLGAVIPIAMFVGNLTPLLIITSACGLAGGEFADLQVLSLIHI